MDGYLSRTLALAKERGVSLSPDAVSLLKFIDQTEDPEKLTHQARSSWLDLNAERVIRREQDQQRGDGSL